MYARRGSGSARGSHSCHWLHAAHLRPLELDGRAGGRGRVGLDRRSGSGRVRLVARERWGGGCGPGLAADLSMLLTSPCAGAGELCGHWPWTLNLGCELSDLSPVKTKFEN